MKSIVRFALTVTAVAACAAASAEPFDAADQQRRERNREEAMARHGDTSATSYRNDEDRPTLREKTHRAADSTRSFAHRQAEKMRRFGDRQNQRYGKAPGPQRTPENNGPQ